MDLRRGGEFAFGTIVVALGVGLLSLAAVHLNGPLVSVPVEVPAQVAQTSSSPPSRASQSRVAVAPASMTRTIPYHPGGLPRADRPHLMAHALSIARGDGRRNVRASVAIAKDVPMYPAIARHAQSHRAVAEPAPHALAKRPSSAASHARIAHAGKPQHRYGIAYVRIAPKIEPTPEPPIGYDDHPTLLRSDAPSAALPTAEPAPVELTRTNRGE